MKRCNHDGWKFIGWMDADDGAAPRWFGCRSCGQRLPYPPANDSQPEVAIEIRLADALRWAHAFWSGEDLDAAIERHVDIALKTIAHHDAEQGGDE